MNILLQGFLARTVRRAMCPMFLAGRQPPKVYQTRFCPPSRMAHLCPQALRLGQIHVKIIPALKNNYMYLLIDVAKRMAAAIDPVEPHNVLKAIVEERVDLAYVLITHHHEDHSLGTPYLIRSWPRGAIPVYGGDTRIPAVTRFFKDKMQLQLGDLTITCLQTPSHTRDHFCFFVEACGKKPHEHILFSGDCLFQAGCGPFDEGLPHNMLEFKHYLRDNLPLDTLIFGGHENTIANLQFANLVEPKNEIIGRRLSWAEQQYKNRKPSVPSTLHEEFCWNPFLRTQYPSVRQFTRAQSDVEAIGILRQMRDKFKQKVKGNKRGSRC